jgi:hypothetical protein
MDMRFGTWNIRRLYRVGSEMKVLNGLCKYKSDLVRWDSGGTEPAGEYTFFY